MSAAAPKVSVIIPTYNSARFLPEALESVFSQNYADYEVIVVDDGSTDETTAVLESNADRIRYVCQPNAGSAAARNTGLDLAQGEFVVFLDADDLLLPGKLKEQAAYLTLRPSLGIVHSGWRIIDEAGAVITEVTPWQEAPVLDLETWLRRKPVKMGAMMMRRIWLESVGGLDPAIRQSHDVDLMLRLALAGCQTEWIYKSTLCYRHHQASTIRRQALNQAHYAKMVLDKFFAHPKIPTDLIARENQTRYYSLIWLAWHLYRSGFTTETTDYLRQSLPFSPYTPERTMLDWAMLFAKWAQADGMAMAGLQPVWTLFREATPIPENTWFLWQRFLEWRVARPESTHRMELIDDKVLWQLFKTIDTHGAEHQIETKLFLDWWSQVWQFYLANKKAIAKQASGNFKGISPEKVVSLMQLSILTHPGPLSASHIKQIWQDALHQELVAPAYKADVTRLYLTGSGQAALGRRWRKAWKFLLPALGGIRSSRGRQAWRQFVQNGWRYFQHGRGQPTKALESQESTIDPST